MEHQLFSFRQHIPVWMIVSLGFFLAFGITYITIPTIVTVSRLKDLCAKPNKRTSHLKEIPNLGGIGIFIGFVISLIIMGGEYLTSDLFYVMAALIMLFFIGIKDDILVIDPKKKFAVQIIVAAVMALLADIRFIHFFGIFNIGEISYFTSISVTILLFVVIINGYNLIDGIDGLTSGVGILSSTILGIWFWKIHDVEYLILSFCLSGSLIAFFLYNVFGKRNKIFLGDTGSMLIGATISILVVRFLRFDLITSPVEYIHSAPAFVLGILILPLFDTLRVFTIRISQGKSPFAADRQHIHHRLLELGFTHLQSTLILLLANVFFIVLCYILQSIGNIPIILLILSLATIMSYLILKLSVRRSKILSGIETYRINNYEKAKINKFIHPISLESDYLEENCILINNMEEHISEPDGEMIKI